MAYTGKCDIILCVQNIVQVTLCTQDTQVSRIHCIQHIVIIIMCPILKMMRPNENDDDDRHLSGWLLSAFSGVPSHPENADFDENENADDDKNDENENDDDDLHLCGV